MFSRSKTKLIAAKVYYRSKSFDMSVGFLYHTPPGLMSRIGLHLNWLIVTCFPTYYTADDSTFIHCFCGYSSWCWWCCRVGRGEPVIWFCPIGFWAHYASPCEALAQKGCWFPSRVTDTTCKHQWDSAKLVIWHHVDHYFPIYKCITHLVCWGDALGVS